MPPFSIPNRPPNAFDPTRKASFESSCDRAFLDLLAELPEVAALFSVDEADGLELRDDALTDWSPVGEAVRMNKMVAAHQALEAAAPSSDEESRLTRAVFREFLEYPTFEPLVGVAGKAFSRHPYLVTQEGGVQTELPLYFVNLHPLECRDDAERYLAKLNRVPATIRGLIESLRDREASALMPPRFLLQQAVAEIRAFVQLDPADSPIVATFGERLRARATARPGKPSGLGEATLDTLQSKVRDAVAHRVYPAYDALLRTLAGQIAHAQEEPGIWRLPEGEDYYAYELRCQTSTDLTPAAVHALGLELVEELTADIHSAFDALGHPRGTLAERYQRLAADPATMWEQSEAGRSEILTQCQRLLGDVDARLGEAFATRPQAPLVIERVPAFCEAARTTTLHPASADGSRPAIFEINLARELQTPKFELPTLVYHEGLPGHHLQFAIAQERSSLSLFRRKVVFHAFVEGWAKYAEQLPWELHWNEDPIWHLAVLRRELVSSANLALDTGIHHERWTREQGIQFAVANTGMDQGFARYLVDRIAARPAQTCSYKMGLVKLRELRARCERALASRPGGFSLPAFHDRLLLHGALPLAQVERAVLGDLDAGEGEA